MGFVMVVETLWGDVRAHVGLIVADGGVVDHSITLGFENEVVELGSAAFGLVSSVNVAVMGLGGVKSSLGMAGALLDGWELVVGEDEC